MNMAKNSHFQEIYQQALQEVSKSNTVQKPQLFINLKTNSQLINYQTDVSKCKANRIKIRQRSLNNLGKASSTPKIVTQVQLSSGRFKILHTKKSSQLQRIQKMRQPSSPSPLNPHSYNTLPVISQISHPKCKQIKSNLVKNIQNYVTNYKSKSVYSAQIGLPKHKAKINIIFKNNMQILKGWEDINEGQQPTFFDAYHLKM